MNKINALFANNKDRKLLSLYFCAGCPTLEGTGDVIKAMERKGIDMIEVGIPFSDPLADGPVIQSAGTVALNNGMTVKKLFAQLKEIKDEVQLPLVLMGYLNPIMHYGIEAFFKSCVESGVSGTIIPDLPFDDYLKVVKPIADKYDIRVIMMITPETSEERIRFIDEHTDGFIYMVSSASITGAQSSFGDAKLAYFNHINGMNLRNPRMIGFGISNKQTLTNAHFLFNHRHGVGLSLQNDQIGLFTHQRLALQYALQNKFLGGTLSVGVQGGMLSEKFDGSKVDLGESGDPAFSTSDVNGSGMDLSLGLYYQHKAWYVGLSAQHLTSPTINIGETNELKIDATYYLTGGYNIRLRNPFLTIKPSVLVTTDGTTWRGDLTGRLVYQYEKRMLYGGVTYSPDRSVTILVGGSFHGVVLGYSYEAYTSKLSAGNGSHELFVGYQTDINLTKKGRNRHQSVRIL